MKIRKILFSLSLAVWLTIFLSEAAMAGDFDGSRTITGRVDRLIEINRQRVVENIDPDTVGLPAKFIIDFKRRTIRGTPDSTVRRAIHIERINHIEDKLILQGADEGVAGTGVAYVAFGTCTMTGN